MSAKAKHAARLRIQHHQITGCIGSKVSCGFYRRKAVSQRIDQFAAAILTPDFKPQRKTSKREDVLGGSGETQEVRSILRIRRFESGALHSIASELENAAVGGVPDVDIAGVIGNSGKRMRSFL